MFSFVFCEKEREENEQGKVKEEKEREKNRSSYGVVHFNIVLFDIHYGGLWGEGSESSIHLLSHPLYGIL